MANKRNSVVVGSPEFYPNEIGTDRKEVDMVCSPPEEEPYKSVKEIDAGIIGILLPDEDDLFSGVIDEGGYNAYGRTIDDLEDFGLFSSVGGMELEGDEHLSSGKRIVGVDGDSVYFGGSKGKLLFGEQPSRTLFVRNINSNVEDSKLKALFEVHLNTPF